MRVFRGQVLEKLQRFFVSLIDNQILCMSQTQSHSLTRALWFPLVADGIFQHPFHLLKTIRPAFCDSRTSHERLETKRGKEEEEEIKKRRGSSLLVHRVGELALVCDGDPEPPQINVLGRLLLSFAPLSLGQIVEDPLC